MERITHMSEPIHESMFNLNSVYPRYLRFSHGVY
jgi:hypothetical protein